jgi:hypothetical protein
MNARFFSSIPEFSRSRGFPGIFSIIVVLSAGVLGGANVTVARDTLHVVERSVSETTIHLGAKQESDSIGDMLVFANPIYDSSNATQVGMVQGTCVRVIVGKSWECFFTLALANDRITLEGPYADTGDSIFAITGGTGRYIGAKGKMSLHARDSSSLSNGAAAVTDMFFDIR